VQLLGTVPGADRHVAEFVKECQRWIDNAGAGAVGAADLLFNRFDDFVPVPGLLGYQVEDYQAKVAMSKKAAEAASTGLSAMAIMSEVAAALAMFFAAVATAVIVMGMSMDHEFSECILT
jgi:hypothetical protein